MSDWLNTDCGLAWAAGFVDGEGSIALCRGGRNRRQIFLRVEVSQSVLEPLEKLQSLFGGSLRQVMGYKRPYWRLNLFGRTAVEMLRRIQPWLVVKAKHAALAIKWADAFVRPSGWNGGGGRGGARFYSRQEQDFRLVIFDEMRRLQKKGPLAARLAEASAAQSVMRATA